MFNWIKNLTKNLIRPEATTSAPTSGTPTNSSAPRMTRVVKRIIPTSQRETEAEVPPPLPPSLPSAKAEPAHSTSIPLPKNFPKPAKTITLPIDEDDDEEVMISAPPVVRLSPAPAEEPEPVGKPATIQLSGGKKSPIKIDIPTPAASNSRQILLTVADFLGKIPANFLNEKSVDASQKVSFDAADLYSDMTKGRASVPLSVIAEALPSLFKRRISAEEDVEIPLPLPKIVAQMGDLLTRNNQIEEDSFEEVETPFLKAAKRDEEIHKVSGSIPVVKPIPTPTQEDAPEPVFKTVPAARSPIAGPKKQSRQITVRVRPLIQAMPIKQREDLLGSIPEDSQVDLPLDEIEGQLPSGRVFLPLATFAALLNPAIRSKFTDSFEGAEVPISLSEIVKNLPTDSIKLREDQHEQEVDPNEFETPFNTTPDTVSTPRVKPAAIDFAIPAAPRSPIKPKPQITPSIANYTTRKLNSVGGKFPSPMHAALGTQESLDAKKVVKLASALPGVASLTVITEDGLSLAGNLPSIKNPEGFAAMAPQLHRKMAGHTIDLKLGELKTLSFTTENHAVTIFTSGPMTIAVIHQNQSDLGHGVKEKFVAIVDGLARQYNPELSAH